MKFVLCAFTILLAVAVYPATVRINSDLFYVLTLDLFEIDFFTWYRMLLIGIMGACSATFFLFRCRDTSQNLCLWGYVALLILSTATSRFPATAVYGTPDHHEGALALLGYVGIYLASKRYGLFKSLEHCLDVVCFVTAFFAVLQLVYGNFLEFPLFKLLVSHLEATAVKWPIYGNLGGSNNLGLFCALFIPYTIVRKKHVQAGLLFALAICCQSMAGWVSIIITTAIVSRRHLLWILLAACLLSCWKHNIVVGRLKEAATQLHFPVRDKDLDGRAYMWKRAIPMLKDSIVLGKGPGTYAIYFPQFTQRGRDMGYVNTSVGRPHNMFINIWQGTGLLSLVALGSYVTTLLRHSKNASLKMGVIGFLIAGLFTDSMVCVTPYFLIFLGGLAHEYNEARRHAQREGRYATEHSLSDDSDTSLADIYL